MTKALPTVKFENATDLIDAIKARKSDEEMAFVREGCRMADEMFKYALTIMEPGKMVYEVINDIVHKWTGWVSELPINIMMGATPEGTPAVWSMGPKRFRKLEKGDQMTFMVEALAPGGIWVELARPICIGKIPAGMEEQHALVREDQKMLLDMLKPGIQPKELWDANNNFLKKHGYQTETRILGHSLGYDMVERPCLVVGETMPIPGRVHMSIHPTVHSPRVHAWICDEFYMDESGKKELLNKTEQKIFVI
jgi:Xaa-Pro aminopeptidase